VVCIAENLKYLRKTKGWTQSELARQLGVKRSLIGAYEEGRADPRLSFLQHICEKFGYSLDQFVSHQLPIQAAPTDIKGKTLRILPIAVDGVSKSELACIVPFKAAAGYLNGYGDVEFIEQLPAFDLPFPELTKGKTYRLFQIEGDSMLPILPMSYIICSYVMDWSAIKNDNCYVVVSKSDGIVYKRVLNNLNLGYLTLKSDNLEYRPYQLPVEQILEIWKAEGFSKMGLDSANEPNASKEILAELTSIKNRLSEIENKLT